MIARIFAMVIAGLIIVYLVRLIDAYIYNRRNRNR